VIKLYISQEYFNSKNWYYGYINPSNFDDSVLNETEKVNVQTIKDYEDYLDH